MTKEELKQEAKEYADKYGKSNFDIWDIARFAYYQSAEPREKRIAELEAQIEKMKCCGNCKHFDFNEPNYCHKGVYRERQYVCGEWCFGN